jgi:hypothetical protein
MKFKVKKRQLEEGDELGVDWDRWADGRARRLKRKRDFGDVETSLAIEAATNAANRMGKALHAIRDRQLPEKYIWVQFADGRIQPGEPCSCGSRRLYRLHPHFVRCSACRALLLWSSGDTEEYESRPAFRLTRLTGVHLARMERSGDRDLYRGYAEKDGTPVVVLAEFRVEGGEELSSEHAFERVEKVEFLPFDGLSDLFDLSALRGGGRSDWDLVL